MKNVDHPLRTRSRPHLWRAMWRFLRTAAVSIGLLILPASWSAQATEPSVEASDAEDESLEADLTPEQRALASLERGRSLYRAYRCDACHELESRDGPLPAPALDQLSGNLHREWLLEWLSESRSSMSTSHRRMPHFTIGPEQAENLADYLLGDNESHDGDTPAADPSSSEAASAGESLFLSIGCIACHRWNDLGGASLFSGGDLSTIGRKRPASFFAAFLQSPARFNRDHRMPIFDLSEEERAQLASFLVQADDRVTMSTRPSREEQELAKSREAGRSWFERFQCGACHRGPDGAIASRRQTDRRRLSAKSRWNAACLSSDTTESTIPHYSLSEEDREQIRAFVEARERPDVNWESLLEPFAIVERGCVACHARGTMQGFEIQLAALFKRRADMAASADSLLPPTLDTVGAKWLPNELKAILAEPTQHRRRHWLTLRMPTYRWRDGELDALVGALRCADETFLEGSETQTTGVPPSRHPLNELRLAGSRLVTADGFGCTSCHAIGSVQPSSPEPGKRGPDLSGIGQRLDPRWFASFVRDPIRVSRRMEMPSIRVPVAGVLDNDLNEQLAAIWHVLSDSTFQPPRPDPVRILRQAYDVSSDQPSRSLVLTDLVRGRGRAWIKPLIVALPHRHHLLYDFEEARLDGWYVGDAAYQRTEGKRWYWELAGEPIWERGADDLPEWMLAGEDVDYRPWRAGQFLSEPDQLLHLPGGGVELRQRLRYERFDAEKDDGQDESRRITLRVVQRWVPWIAEDKHGFERTIEVQDVPERHELRLRVTGRRSADHLVAEPHGGPGIRSLSSEFPATVELFGSSKDDLPRWEHSDELVWPSNADRESYRCQLRYTTSLAVDRFPNPVKVMIPIEAKRILSVPGFVGQRLPLPPDEMPTALAWASNGGDSAPLFVSSLKGRVLRIVDTNGDRLEDEQTAFSDELATPFGLAASDNYVDVITKTSLQRLTDRDDDGHADEAQTLASGWGHTDDYHDWAVGLPEDGEGRYYVGLPCQQDDRSAAAAHWRGRILRLVPRPPTRENPHPFSIEEFARGQRFPMGMAINRAGELFATDNQGNYNPFNELNHIVAGRHYGFVNQLERQRGEAPSRYESPAIAMPHPWTRSVNGICFLEVPDGAAEGSPQSFGPFTGHLVGCEYDTRRLVRMTLEKVNGEIQGAVYPLSRLSGTEDGSGRVADTASTASQTAPVDQSRLEAGAERAGMDEQLTADLLGPLCCAISPDGALYVGGLRDSGWGGANNIGEILRLDFNVDCLPPGIARLSAIKEGLSVTFTRAVDERLATQTERYALQSFYREATPAYGGDDQGRRAEPIREVTLAADRMSVSLKLKSLEAGRVYELRLQSLVESSAEFFPAEAFYTMKSVPR